MFDSGKFGQIWLIHSGSSKFSLPSFSLLMFLLENLQSGCQSFKTNRRFVLPAGQTVPYFLIATAFVPNVGTA